DHRLAFVVLEFDLKLRLAILVVDLCVVTDVAFSLQHVQHACTQVRSRRGNGGLATAIGIANAGEHIAEGITKGHRSSSLPARLDQAGNQAVIAEFAQRYTAHLELAVECTRTAGNLATVADAGLGRIARKRG